MEPNQKISEHTVHQLKEIIPTIVKETLEDKEARSSTHYINSIREAREEYTAGNFSKLKL